MAYLYTPCRLDGPLGVFPNWLHRTSEAFNARNNGLTSRCTHAAGRRFADPVRKTVRRYLARRHVDLFQSDDYCSNIRPWNCYDYQHFELYYVAYVYHFYLG